MSKAWGRLQKIYVCFSESPNFTTIFWTLATRWADNDHYITTAPHDFLTFRHPCSTAGLLHSWFAKPALHCRRWFLTLWFYENYNVQKSKKLKEEIQLQIHLRLELTFMKFWKSWSVFWKMTSNLRFSEKMKKIFSLKIPFSMCNSAIYHLRFATAARFSNHKTSQMFMPFKTHFNFYRLGVNFLNNLLAFFSNVQFSRNLPAQICNCIRASDLLGHSSLA